MQASAPDYIDRYQRVHRLIKTNNPGGLTVKDGALRYGMLETEAKGGYIFPNTILGLRALFVRLNSIRQTHTIMQVSDYIEYLDHNSGPEHTNFVSAITDRFAHSYKPFTHCRREMISLAQSIVYYRIGYQPFTFDLYARAQSLAY